MRRLFSQSQKELLSSSASHTRNSPVNSQYSQKASNLCNFKHIHNIASGSRETENLKMYSQVKVQLYP